ncbi:Uncharacterised protein g1588 [Pycnogonum litorale]
MFDNTLTDVNRNATNGFNVCAKSCNATKFNGGSNHNTSSMFRNNIGTKIAKNGYSQRSNDFNKTNGIGHRNGSIVSSNCRISWDENLPFPKIPFDKACLLSFVVAVVCFANSYQGRFVFDDSEAIVNNKDVKLSTPLANLFFNDFWGTAVSSNISHKSFRPLTVLSFRFNHWLVGSLDPTSFHLTNIILHGIVCVFVLLLFAIVLSTNRRFSSFSEAYEQSPIASMLCSLLFACHPIHSESVAGIVGRADLLCAMFFLFSFFSYVKSCSTNGVISAVMLIFNVLFCMMSLLFKEQGITVFGLCLVYDIIVINEVCLDDLLIAISSLSSSSLRCCSSFDNDCTRRKYRSKMNLHGFAFRITTLVASSMVMLFSRWYIMGGSAPSFQRVDNPASFMDTLLLRAVNYNYIYSINAWLLIHPSWLCFDWSMGCVPLIKSLSDPRMTAVISFWIAIAGLLYSAFYLVNLKFKKILIMSFTFIVVPFLPASNVFFRVGFVIAERTLYLPSIGFCIIVVIGLHQLANHLSKSQMQIFFVILLSSFTARCIQRSHEWTNEKLLFQSGLKVCPLNAKVHYNIAKTAADNGDKNTAVFQYSEAIKLNPDYDQALNNLANILKDNGQLDDAERLLLSAIYIRPDFAAAWMNLGIVQASLRKHYKAEQSYLIALSHRKHYPDCLYNLGNLVS